MIAQPTQKPVWVATPAALQSMLRDISQRSILAMDTESNSLFAYREQVCMLQISTGQTDYLLDPLQVADLSPLAPIFASPQIEKVFHAAEYDVICLKRDFNFHFENLFDTMVAVRILGRPAVGLASILESEFNIHLDKKFQRANWGQRPLPQAQLEYARLDSFYLIPLRERLKVELQEKGFWELAQEDFRRMCQVAAGPLNENGDAMWRIVGRQEFSPQQAAVLHELLHYRDERARVMNVPTFKVLGNDLLFNIALAAPRNRERLMNVEGVTDRILHRHADGLLHAVERGLGSPPIHRPPSKRPDERYIMRLESLREWRKETAKKTGVESDVVLPRDLLEEIARVRPANMQELQQVMRSSPWRCEHFGAQLLEVIQR
jgi:ribonuclease D